MAVPDPRRPPVARCGEAVLADSSAAGHAESKSGTDPDVIDGPSVRVWPRGPGRANARDDSRLTRELHAWRCASPRSHTVLARQLSSADQRRQKRTDPVLGNGETGIQAALSPRPHDRGV